MPSPSMPNPFRRARFLPFMAGLATLWSLNSLADTHSVTIDTCNSSDFQALLHPATNTPTASAFWLNRELVQWPNTSTTGNFRLYYSMTGKLVATAGSKVSGADGAVALGMVDTKTQPVPETLRTRFKYLPDGAVLRLTKTDTAQLETLHKAQVLIVQENKKGDVIAATALQIAGALDDIYASASNAKDLGVTVTKTNTQFKLWAPTAQQVSVCTYATGSAKATAVDALQWDAQSGIWSLDKSADLSGQYYKYVVDVFVRGAGVVRNLVTDPYSVSLTADSKRSYIVDLNSPSVTPKGWDKTAPPDTVRTLADQSMYELHVRDFSINDKSVKAANRGKYLAFTEKDSNGVKHLRHLAKAGMTDVHLLPIYDIATVPEVNCAVPEIKGGPNSETQQAAISAVDGKDCFNWGYDPFHYNSPEGSYSSDPTDGAKRILETRKMVMALHDIGLRVGMDVVYNHTFQSGQGEKSVLDRVVPGYYHRYNLTGDVEHSTCCENTATENLMMGKLMVDSAVIWARDYKMDSFRFDLMGHQPLSVMKELQAAVNAASGREVQMIGEGWNFGEVGGNARFVQAAQLNLGGTGIGSFSDRARDYIRGQSYSDSGEMWITRKGYVNGLANPDQSRADLLKAADMVRVGLAGTLRDYSFITADGNRKAMHNIDYSGNPAGYTSQPGEAVNYVENHDNQTLFDVNVYKLPTDISREERARVQVLALATTAFSQGIAYFHAGVEILRSKSMDRDSFNSGDWFNRLDWTYNDNYFGTGMPTKLRNIDYYSMVKPLLANPAIKPTKTEIVQTRDMFLDLLRIRSSSTLFRLKTLEEVQQRLHFYNTGAKQNGAVIVGKLNGRGYEGANYDSLLYFINVATEPQTLVIPEEKNGAYTLHPVHLSKTAGDPRPAAHAKYNASAGSFIIPARTALVFVKQHSVKH